MIKIKNTISLVILLSSFLQLPAQFYVGKTFYLVDSLTLIDLTESDKLLIDTSLTIFHNTNYDSIKIESLKTIINNCWTPTAWVAYNEYSNDFAGKKLKNNRFSSQRDKVKMKSLLGLTQYYIGYTNDVRGNIIDALKYYKKGLKTYKDIDDKEGVAMSLNNIGELYFEQGKIFKGLNIFHIGLDISTKIGFKEGMASNNRSLGDYYYSQKEFEKALNNYNISLALYTELNKNHDYTQDIGFCNSDIGNIYEIKKEYDTALKYYLKALDLHKDLGDQLGTAKSLSDIAYINKIALKYNTALAYYSESIAIYKAVGDDAHISSCLYHIADINFKIGNLKESLNLGLRSLTIAQSISYPRYIQRTAELLSNIYKQQKDGMKAIEMFELFISTRDSLANIDTQKAIFKEQTRYEYEKQKAIDDTENEKLLAIEKEEKEKQRVIIIATTFGFVLTGFFLYIIFNRLRITQKQKNIINEQKIIVEKQKSEVEKQRDNAHTQKLIVEEKNKEILESITYAKRIQEAILPPPRLVKEWLTESFIFYKPKDIVAGDFYWMETSNYTVNDREKTLVYFAAADCTGHGVPGAMISVVCANALNRAIKEFNLIEPGQVLDKVSQLVIEALEKGEDKSVKDGMDIALCALDISSKKVFYSGANNPLYRITNLKEKVDSTIKTESNETHQLIEYKATKQPVGQYDNSIKFNTIEIQLQPGDAIYVFSDGFPDQFGGEKGKKYKYSSFRKTLLANFTLSMENQKRLLEKEFNNWKGNLEQIDDVCVIGVKINGVEKNNFTKRELEVLSFLQDGLPSKLIADKLNLSTHTIDTYRRRLLAKTGTYNTTELINYCVKKEII